MAQQGPNPIELYEAACKSMLPTMGGISESNSTSATPCSEWNAQSVINHAIAVQHFANNVLTGAAVDPSTMGNVAHPLPPEGAQAALKAITDTTLATLKAIDLEKVVETPFGSMPGKNFIMIPIADMVIHKWDLAKATGQDTSIDSGLAEVCLQALQGALSQGRDAKFFAAEVSVPATASVQDRLIALSGRQP